MPPTNVATYVTKIAFCVTLIFTYPLQISPANNVIESYITNGMPKSKKRMWIKNVSRLCIIIFTLVLALLVWTSISSFLEVIGALTCAPLAFTMPALFHIKVAETSTQKGIDIFIVILSICLGVFCTYFAVKEWVSPEE